MTHAYTIESFDAAAIAETCARDGVCHVKGFFSDAEMDRIRSGLEETHARYGEIKPDPLSCRSLHWLVVHPRLREIAKAVLGPELVYYTNGSINYEPEIGTLTNSPYVALHTDAAGRPDHLRGYPNRDKPFPAIRFAIYMQDYTASSGSVRVAPGSHLWTDDFDTSAPDAFSSVRVPPPSQADAIPENFISIVPTEPGDLVIWNVATIHGAGAKRLKEDTEKCLHPRDEAALWDQDPLQFLPPPGPRNAIFFDYGAVSEETDLYIKAQTQTLKPKRLAPFALGRSDDDVVQGLMAFTETRLREDGLIVSLAIQIERAKKDAAKNETAFFDLFKRFFKVADRHEEFSSHYALFDRAPFEKLKRDDWQKAAAYAQQSTVQRVIKSHNES